MSYLPELQHENSDNISVRQINKFGGYNHNKVISDYEFYDMENMNGDDYPALSVRNGRSGYVWSVYEQFLTKTYAAKVAVYHVGYVVYCATHITGEKPTFEEYLTEKGLEHLISYEAYENYLHENENEFFETYFQGNYNGSLDYDGLIIVKGNFLYYNGIVICEVEDSKKILTPIGDNVVIFPDKKILNMTKVKENFDSGYEDFCSSINYFKDCVSSMDACRNYVGTEARPSTSNLIDDTSFSDINAEFVYESSRDETALNDSWFIKVKSGTQHSMTVESYEDDEMGACLHIVNNRSTLHGLYQKISYLPGSNITFKLSFYARRDDYSDDIVGRRICPYISEGAVSYSLGKSVYISTEWEKYEIEQTITVPASGTFIVSIDSGSGARNVLIAKPALCRVLTAAENSCAVEMTHYTLAAYTAGENMSDSFSSETVNSIELSGVDNVIDISDAWKVKCSVGSNTKLSVDYDEIYSGSLYYELSGAATIKGIYQQITHESGTFKVRMSFMAKADRNNVPIKPYISSSNTVAIDKGKTVYLTTEWQKVVVEKTVTVGDDGYFTVSLDGISAGSARGVWFSKFEIVEIVPKDISTDFKVLDAVHIKAEYAYDGQTFEAEHDAVIYDISEDGSVLTFNDYALLAMFPEDCIIYEEQVDGTTMYSLSVGDAKSVMLSNLEISRTAPDIDFACSCHNKIWGVNKKENVIYASYYNDATNWNFFEGIAADSFYGECTSPGVFTAAVAYGGYPLFFKERHLVTVYGSDSSEFVVTEKEMRGVEEGSEQAVVCVNEMLYYKSFDGVMRFAGGLPVSIGDALGNEKYHSAVFGADYSKLYASMLDKDNEPQLFVYDTENQIWYKEDPIRAQGFVFCDESLKIIDEDSGDTIILNDADSDEFVRWFVETGDFYDGTPAKKYIWRLIMRIGLEEHSSVKIYLQYNSSSKWELVKEIKSNGKKAYSIPLQCKRTDHLRMRIEGEGKATIYTVAKRLLTGSYI